MLSYHNSFLDHIAHISTMISRRIQTCRIKDKFNDLKRFSPEEFVGYDLPGETVAPVHMDLATAFKIRLWKVLQTTFGDTKYRDHVAVKMLGQQNWRDDHLNRSLVGRETAEHNESLPRDYDTSCQEWFFENLHDKIHEEGFEDNVDGGFTIEESEPIKYDTFDDLLYDENLAMEAPVYLNYSSGEQNDCLYNPSGVKSHNQFIKRTQNFLRESMEYSADSKSSSVCDNPFDELWEALDQGLHVNGDESLLDDFPSDEGSQSLDLLTEDGFHYEMMMDD